MKIAVYPGSFDPVTYGHLDIIKRAAKIFDELYVCVMVNSNKHPVFSMAERLDFIKRVTADLPNVHAETSDDLLVRYAQKKGAVTIVKGLRAVTDFDAEFQMALANRSIDSTVDTVFLASNAKYTYLSSTIVREMAKFHTDLTEYVPKEIIDDILKKFETGGK